MSTLEIALALLGLLLVLLSGGVWVAISLGAVAWFGLQFFTSTPPDVNLFQSFWGSSASWTLAALPRMVKEQLWKGVRFCFFDRHLFSAPRRLATW